MRSRGREEAWERKGAGVLFLEFIGIREFQNVRVKDNGVMNRDGFQSFQAVQLLAVDEADIPRMKGICFQIDLHCEGSLCDLQDLTG